MSATNKYFLAKFGCKKKLASIQQRTSLVKLDPLDENSESARFDIEPRLNQGSDPAAPGSRGAPCVRRVRNRAFFAARPERTVTGAGQILEGSFSAVSKPNFASKYAKKQGQESRNHGESRRDDDALRHVRGPAGARRAHPGRRSPCRAFIHSSSAHRQTLEGSFSAVSKPNFASKYAFESSRRDLQNALLCTALKSHFRAVNFLNFANFFRNFSEI